VLANIHGQSYAPKRSPEDMRDLLCTCMRLFFEVRSGALAEADCPTLYFRAARRFNGTGTRRAAMEHTFLANENAN
jgi:hypothetical protein